MPKIKKETLQETPEQDPRVYGFYCMAESSSSETEIELIHKNALSSIKQIEGAVLKPSHFTKQELAFPIKNSSFAYISHIIFKAAPDKIEELKEAIRSIEGPIIRFIITKEKFNAPRRKPAPIKDKARPSKTPEKSEAQDPTKEEQDKKVTISDIDKKLDEIMDNI